MSDKTTKVCDVCGEELVGGGHAGVVAVSDKQEVRFDLCSDDLERLFGKLETKPRRSRKRATSTAAA